MTASFSGQVVLVGGASGGVGRAASTMLLDGGASVALHYRRNASEIQAMVDKYGTGRVLGIQADLCEPGAPAQVVATTLAKFGKIDAFLNTVGSALRMQPFLDIPEATVEETISIELRSVIAAAKAVLPALIANGGGRMVLVGSDSGKVGTSGEAISAACRGGVIALAKSLAREYARANVLVNVICPGPTDTSLWDDLVAKDEFGGKIGNAMIRAIPLRRIGKPEEVAAAAVFLVSEQASFITGQAISVSGGLTMS
jgi:NAD(P)-dependent dehydrogenase (short-subunit alcohol dehydrogenase family)